MSPACPPSIVLAGADTALAEIRAALGPVGATGPLELDLAGLAGFDSSALAVLLAVRREYGLGVALRNVPPNLRTLARLYGVEAVLFDPRSPALHGGSDQPHSSDRPMG